MQRWYPDYQPRDYELVDYERFYVDGCDVPFRGPPLNPFHADPGSYFTTLGAVQTMAPYIPGPIPCCSPKRSGCRRSTLRSAARGQVSICNMTG